MKKWIPVLLLFGLPAIAQEPDMSKRTVIVFLSSEMIAEKNFPKDGLVNWIKELQQQMAGLMQTEKSNAVVKMIASWSPNRKCVYAISTCPAQPALAEKVQEALKTVNSPVADFAPFELQLSFKFNEGCNAPDTYRPELYPAAEIMRMALDTQSLAQRKETIRNWALKEVIPVLSYFTKTVDDRFPGVQWTGKSLEGKYFLNRQVPKITDQSALYWRGLMEMNKGNLIIAVSKVFMHVANEEFDLARRYLDMLYRFADKEALATHYLLDLNKNLDLFYQCHDSLVRAGIKKHDAGEYTAAIRQYDQVLSVYPQSAWAQYEKYFSGTYVEKLKNNPDKMTAYWNKHKSLVYGADPLYPMAGGAGNAKDGYILFRHLQVKELFKDRKKLKEDLIQYAAIAVDCESYAFAAHLYWYLMTVFPEEKYKGHSLLVWYLYSLEKMGVTEPQTFFKEDFKKELAGLDKEREDIMKNDPVYKSFKE